MAAELKYCTGCGYCTNGIINSHGFYRPASLEDIRDTSICPYNYMPKLAQKDAKNLSILGEYNTICYGYSADTRIRKIASTGGTITTIAKYVLEKKLVDAVIQVGADQKDPLRNCVYITSNPEDVSKHCGSRYGAVALLRDIHMIIDSDYTYAIIGKPCDIEVVRALMNQKKEYSEKIKYLISFFCGGTSSIQATEAMVNDCGVRKDELNNITYRGNGWPGKVTIKTDKEQYQIEYETSWQKYLGRDLMPMCRFCWDGLGQCADITCGDGWYVKNNKPDFSEGEGRNVIIARNKKGYDLLNMLVREGKLIISEFTKDDIDNFKYMQNGQFNRKTTMFSKVLVTKLMKREVPEYNLRDLFGYVRLVPLKKNISVALGTYKRIKDGKI